MIRHIDTITMRLAVDGAMAGGQPAGPNQNGIAQGQCALDIGIGVAQAAMDQIGGIAGAAAVSVFSGSGAAMLGAVVAGTVNGSIAAVQAFAASEACQTLDNPAQANQLGLGAIQAP